MVYPNLQFSEAKTPYFYANFVATLDGKVQVLTETKSYWPLGSKLDYETLIELRTYADVLIHGSTTALAHPTIQSLSKPAFHEARIKNGKNTPILYMILSNHPTDALLPKIIPTHKLVQAIIVTNEKAPVSDLLAKHATILRVGKNAIDITLLPKYFKENGLNHILVEGGPSVMGSFIKAKLLDELFMTLAPKIVGNKDNQTLTMVENMLLKPNEVATFSLLSHTSYDNELFLRYKRNYD